MTTKAHPPAFEPFFAYAVVIFDRNGKPEVCKVTMDRREASYFVDHFNVLAGDLIPATVRRVRLPALVKRKQTA